MFNIFKKDLKIYLKSLAKNCHKLCDDRWLCPPSELPELTDLQTELHQRGEHLLSRHEELVLVSEVALHIHPYSGSSRTSS